MRRAGVEVFFDAAAIAVVGLVEVLRHWGDIRAAMDEVRGRLQSDPPDLLVLVDYPEFNLKMARHARSLGIRVLFYISPQVWAWRRGRVRKIRRMVRRMLVLFPFEVEFYEQAGVPVSFVGHPVAERRPQAVAPERLRAELGIGAAGTDIAPAHIFTTNGAGLFQEDFAYFGLDGPMTVYLQAILVAPGTSGPWPVSNVSTSVLN